MPAVSKTVSLRYGNQTIWSHATTEYPGDAWDLFNDLIAFLLAQQLALTDFGNVRGFTS
jgi:hypothetical protein